MKIINLALLNFLLLSTCTSPIEVEEPLYFTTMTHMEGGWLDDKDEDLFLRHVDQLHYGMDLAEEYGAILTIESEKPFAKASNIWGVNIMKEVLDRGHGVGTHCDLGGPNNKKETVEQLTEEMKENKELVDELVGSENNHGCSGGGGYADWAQAAVNAGFDYINGIVGMHLLAVPQKNRPYIAKEAYHDNIPEDLTDRIYLMQLENTLDFKADESGIVVSNGELGRLDALAGDDEILTKEDVKALVAIIEEAAAERDPTQVAKLCVYLPANIFEPENEESLIYFFSEMQKLEEAGTIQWATQWEVVESYLESVQ
jgi:hypothetical protein